MDAPRNVEAVDTTTLISSSTDDAEWTGGFFAYGGDGADRSTVVTFSIPPGKRLGRHTDTAEETQFVRGGSGEILLDDRAKPIGKGDVIVLTKGTARPPQHRRRGPRGDRVLRRSAGSAALDRGGLGAGVPEGDR